MFTACVHCYKLRMVKFYVNDDVSNQTSIFMVQLNSVLYVFFLLFFLTALHLMIKEIYPPVYIHL